VTFKQLLCGLMGGHLKVTRTRYCRRYIACYVCDRKLSPGWDLRDTRHRRFAKPEDGAKEQPVVSRVAQETTV
jgi:hypothetical protein